MFARKKVVFYPYNEHLPCNRAHDVYVFQNCASLANEGVDVSLLCGNQSSSNLNEHYLGEEKSSLNLKKKFLLRKSRLCGLSWNLPFFASCQKEIEQKHPSFVICSVLKQGFYHVERRVSGVKYVYEVHEVARYPGQATSNKFELEKQMLSKMDLIIVTTKELKTILRNPPYNIKVPIEIVELAVQRKPLAPPPENTSFRLLYVGQLYKAQGVEDVIEAIKDLEIEFHIVGGKPEEIEKLKMCAADSVIFHGFHPPSSLDIIAQQCHVCISPFHLEGRMPYVAHTKLYEYAAWGRPFIAPQTPLVSEHFKRGCLTYPQGKLKETLQELPTRYSFLLKELKSSLYDFSWKSRAERYKTLLEAYSAI